MAYDRDRWEPDLDYEDEPVYSEDDDGSARSIRRLLDFAATPEPSSLWGELVRDGYQVVYALEIEGIPYLFAERDVWTIRGQQAPARNADFTVSYALVLDEGTTFSVECDREKGVASGRAVDFVFGRQQLADEAIGPVLFARPSKRANLTATVNDPAADTFDVDSTTTDAWSDTGLFYVGRECVRYTSKTATTFGGCIRGVAGYPHYHTADTIGGYRQCTDTPVFWRGRLVTVWAHLCGPDGRFLGERLGAHGQWCRQEWRGYVRDAPRPAAGGIVITALPLVRLAAQEVGAEVSGRMLPDWIVSEPGDVLTVTSGSTVTIPGRAVGGSSGIISLSSWAQVAAAQASADLSEDVTIKIQDESLHLVFSDVAPFGDVYVISSHAWFLEPGVYVTPQSAAGIGAAIDIPLTWSTRNAPLSGVWVVAEMDPSADASEADVGTSGMLLLEGRTGRRLCRYDAVRRTDRTLMAFRTRGVALDTWLPTPSGPWSDEWNPWRDEVTVRVIGGAAGTWRAALETILTSSGTGARGARDTLPIGFGLGLPSSWTTARSDIGQQVIALTSGRASPADLLCGWLALRRECLVQRRQDDGAVTLDIVSTDVVDDPTATTILDRDVLMDGHEAPELIEAPNHVRVTSSDLVFDTPLVVVRDAVRAQAEGVRALDVKAPGMRRETALELGGEMLLLGTGQSAIRLSLPPWVDVQVGDAVEVTSQHPALWSWSSGAFAPSSVLGRVVGWSRQAWSQSQEITVLLAGHAQERINLCPCARVEQIVSSTVFRVEKDGAEVFAAGDEVLIYTRGDEDGTTYTRTLDAIDTSSDNYDLFTVDSAVAGPSESDELVFTFANAASVTVRQGRFMFVRATSEWR